MYGFKLLDEEDEKKQQNPAWTAHWMKPKDGLDAGEQIRTPFAFEAGDSSRSVSRNVPEEATPRLLEHDVSSDTTTVQQLQNYPNDLEIRVMDSVEEIESGCNEIPHTTHRHSLLVKNGVQFNPLQENSRFGVELHSLTSSADSKHGNEEDPESRKSTETVTLENTPKQGASLTESFKDINLDLNLPLKVDDASCSAEEGPPEFLPESTSNYACNASSICTEEAENRWSKRLKLNPPPAQGKKQVHMCPTPNKGNDSLLSNPWIRRWLRNKPSINMKIIQNSRLRRIVATALTGKVMLNFKPCALQQKGFITLWHASAF